MNKNLQISKSLIITFLLTIYFGICAADIFCLCKPNNFNHIALERKSHSKNKHHDENTGKKHHGNSKSDGCCSNSCDCCKNATINFIAELPKLITLASESKLKTFSNSIFNPNIAKREYITSQFIAYQYKLPPPKIPDVRIFIQSFII